MSIKEFYEKLNEDYSQVLSRLHSEELINALLGMLLEDESFQNLKVGIETSNVELAFRSSHTIKGVLLNLGLNNIAKLSADLTDHLRNDTFKEGYLDLFKDFCDQYSSLLILIKDISL